MIIHLFNYRNCTCIDPVFLFVAVRTLQHPSSIETQELGEPPPLLASEKLRQGEVYHEREEGHHEERNSGGTEEKVLNPVRSKGS